MLTDDSTQPRDLRLRDDQMLLLYDGTCGLCHGLVRFLLKRDRADRLRFAPLQSALGRDLVRRHGGNPDQLSTVYVIERFGCHDEYAWRRGRAALTALHALGGAWRLVAALRVLPSFILDAGYRLVAATRYRLFGRVDLCDLPSRQDRDKFLAT